KKFKELKPLADRHWRGSSSGVPSSGQQHQSETANNTASSSTASENNKTANKQNLDSLELGTLKLELKRLQQDCSTVVDLIQVLDAGQNLRRWAEAHMLMISVLAKRFHAQLEQQQQQQAL
ncbi:unnamed protein product, partial [Amoebophrya sp. A120]